MAQAKAGGRRRRKTTRTRLLEEQTETALRRRGVELIGLGLVFLGCLVFAMLWTYDPDDPSLFSATDAVPNNALGLLGALLADPLHRALGWAAYGIPVTFGVWGLRLVLHRGESRILTRIIMAPLAIAVAAVFAAAHVPFDDWTYAYGLGGMFGDSLFLALLSVIPLPTQQATFFATILLGAGFVMLSGIALGVNGPEARSIGRFLMLGLLTSYDAILRATGRAARGAGDAAKAAAERRRAAAAAPKVRREPSTRRAAAAAPVDAAPVQTEPRSDDEDRVMARIAAAVRRRDEARRTEATPMALDVPTLDAEDDDDLIDHEPIAPQDDTPYAAPPPPAPRMLDRRNGGTEPPVTRAERPEPPAAPRVQQPERKPPAKSTRARSEEQPSLALGDADNPDYVAPPLSLLENPASIVRQTLSNDALEQNARMLETVLDDYGVRGEIVSVRPGPVVTMYELEPAAGLKASRVIGLADDIARSMSALAARVSTIPGRTVIGIELPNDHREKVLLRELLAHRTYGDGHHKLPLALGKDIGGEPVIANLAKMPHLLIAGTTGSGKSVSINTMILSLLYKLTPEQCRLIMIDPKMLELSVYDGIPHLLSPVVTDPKKAVVALKWVVAEMEERYRKMSKMGVRNIDGYNGRVQDALDRGEAFTRTVQTGFDDETGEPVFETEEYAPEKMPFIVVIVDEMADLMMVAGKEIEACIQRLAQMARASGIHLIMATQRPSVDVITGTIKANFPTRISFQVTSKIDSRTILGEQGAEQLLGMGDMLYMAGGGRVTRVHAPFCSDEEVEEVVKHLKLQGEPEYVSGVQDGPEAEQESEIDLVLGLGGNTSGEDALYDQAVAIVARDRKCSTSYIQRKLGIGYNKAARLVEQMEDEGVVSQANHVGKREVLVPEV
ncbi:FtsK/SpoIIIE family DNA translocase [Halovulum sp. GXIMD14794]